MQVMTVIEFFSTFMNVPVPIEEVREHIAGMVPDERIRFIEVDGDPTIIRGFLSRRQKKVPGGAELTCSDIYVFANQDEKWKRLVCCKEMLHILDDKALMTSTKEEVIHLVNRMALPLEFSDIKKDGPQPLADRIATMQALAILCPMDAREELVEYFKNGTLSEEDISDLFAIPLYYVGLVMLDEWRELVEHMAYNAQH